MSTKTSKDFVIERSTTRLYAPPGGKTSICLGGGYDAEQSAPQRTMKFSQNNVSTLNFGDMQNQPAPVVNSARGRGNQSTLSFGDYKDEPVVKKTPTKSNPVPLINITNMGDFNNMSANKAAQKPVTVNSARGGDSHSNIFGQCDGKSSVRIRQAPGGTSTIFFG